MFSSLLLAISNVVHDSMTIVLARASFSSD